MSIAFFPRISPLESSSYTMYLLLTMKANFNLLSDTEVLYDYGEAFIYPDGLNDVYVSI